MGQNMRLLLGVGFAGWFLLLTGCMTSMGYQPAEARAGIIQNPSIGWNGYSVRIPDGFSLFNPESVTKADQASLTARQRNLMKNERDLSRVPFVRFIESFLFENEADTCHLKLICVATDIPFQAMIGPEKHKFLKWAARRISIEEEDPHYRFVTINGNEALYISSIDQHKNVIEGLVMFGSMRELYLFEGRGAVEQLSLIRSQIQAMAESMEL